MLQYHPDNPQRPVDWRWERARIIREQGNRFRDKNTDEWTKKALVFQRAYSKCENDYARYDLMCKMPSLYFAFNLRSTTANAGKKVIGMKDEIEARLLADESPEEIADRVGCSAETIDYYEKLFFNVKDKLKYTTYILHQVIGPAIHRGLYEREHDLLWKLYGYFCGSRVIDALTTTFTNPIKPRTTKEVDAMLVDDTRETMRRKAAMAARTVPVNEHTQLAILQTYAQFLEIERDTDAAVGENTIIENIKEMMCLLPWATGTDAVTESRHHKLLTYYDTQSAELRADEVLAISANAETEEHQTVATMKFPEALKHGKDEQGR